jgi:two-component system sensor histidine kinase HupT/HoxJ
VVIVLLGRHIMNRLWEQEFEARHQLQQTLAELQRTQQQLIQSEKMSALGRLVAGVAHEFNNPLSVIASNLHPLARAVETLAAGARDDKPELTAAQQTIRRSLELMRSGIERAEAVTSNLRQYSAPPRGRRSPVDLNAVVELSVALVTPRAREQAVQLHCEYGALAPVLGEAQSLSQVFVNVLANACDAATGKIWVRTAVGKEPGSAVVTIRDDGPGIAPEHLSQLYEPFFTTKPPGAGMGLGLALARRIVEQQQGQIEISNASPGALVVITLPTVAQPEILQSLVQPAHADA